ncbi:glycosyltransferase [Chloroflexota bacterium]
MNILQVTAFFSPVHGGSAEVPYHLSKGLAKRGHQVTVYTSDSKLSPDYVNNLPAAKIHAFKTWLCVAKFYITPGIIRNAKKNIRRFDIIHMHNFRTFQNIVMHHYAKKYGIPYVLQAHGSFATFFQKGLLKKLFDAFWGYDLLKDAARVLAVTKAEAQQYKEITLSQDEIDIIPYGIDLSEFDNLPQRGEFRKKYNLSSDQKVILYLGRIDKVKGLDLLAQAFTQVLNDLKKVILVIAGPDYGYRTTLIHLTKALEIEGKVIFTGPLYGRNKLEAYVDADVYVLPSSYEILGITVLEALACGTPVIVTNRCGIAETVNGQAGLVVPYNQEQLQTELFRILLDTKLRRMLGERGKLLVREKFDWDKIVEQVESVYQKAL